MRSVVMRCEVIQGRKRLASICTKSLPPEKVFVEKLTIAIKINSITSEGIYAQPRDHRINGIKVHKETIPPVQRMLVNVNKPAGGMLDYGGMENKCGLDDTEQRNKLL